MKSSRRYNRILLGVAGLFTLTVGAINSTVNPWRVTPVPWQSSAMDPYRGDADHIRTRKAGILRAGDWGVALVGSSRVANAMDPDLPQWGRRDVANLGCYAGFLQETPHIGRKFLATEPAELLLFGIDPGDLTSPVDTRPMFDFYSSPFSPDAGFDDELRYAFGLSTLDSSLSTLKNYRQRATVEFDPTGMRRHPKKHAISQIGFIATNIVAQIALKTADAGGPEREFNPEKVRKVRELIEDARRRDCRMIVFVHASHALMHAEARHIGTDVIPFEKERRLLTSMIDEINRTIPGTQDVALWDFCNYHPYHCEPLPLDDPDHGRLKNWLDLGHFLPEGGTAMLGTMMGWPLEHPEWQGFGRRITPANLEAYLAEVGAGYQRYMTDEGARDLAWKEDLKAKSKR